VVHPLVALGHGGWTFSLLLLKENQVKLTNNVTGCSFHDHDLDELMTIEDQIRFGARRPVTVPAVPEDADRAGCPAVDESR